MTTITYQATADLQFKGLNWTAYMRKKPSLTKIFWEVWDKLKELEGEPFSSVLPKLQEAEFESRASHYVTLNSTHTIVEIYQYGVMPIIWIEFNQKD